jgi:hypothetical protein
MVGLRRHLLDSAAIAARVTARVYTPILPQKVSYPAIQLQLISDVEDLQMRGPDGLTRVRIQVDSWAQTRDAAQSVGRLCVQRLNGFLGMWMGDPSTSPPLYFRVLGVALQSASEQFEQEVMGGICRHSADYFVHFKDPDVGLI